MSVMGSVWPNDDATLRISSHCSTNRPRQTRRCQACRRLQGRVRSASSSCAAADVAQRLVQSGKTLGSARALELAAALCAGFRRALGLRQEEQTLPVQEEEEEPQREVPTKCTFASTSGAFVEQHWYNCATCGLVGDKGACAACIRTCHAGHDISYARKSSFFCDCGARGSTAAAACSSIERVR